MPVIPRAHSTPSAAQGFIVLSDLRVSLRQARGACDLPFADLTSLCDGSARSFGCSKGGLVAASTIIFRNHFAGRVRKRTSSRRRLP